VFQQVGHHLDHQVLDILSEVNEPVGVAFQVALNFVVGHQSRPVSGAHVEAKSVRPAEIDAVALELRREVIQPVQAFGRHLRGVLELP
jgi:hypothetical protein